MRRTHALAVEVVRGAEAIKDHAARADLALGRDRQDFVDAAAELGVDDHLGEDAPQRPVELESGAGEALAGRNRDREGVDVQLGGGRRDQADLHGSFKG